jgi:CRP-like cAMP-binding protein
MAQKIREGTPAAAPADVTAPGTGDHLFAICPNMTGVRMRYARNEAIYGRGEEARLVYKVVTGAVRTQRCFADGRRQIDAFYLPGELFGLECSGAHKLAAEATVDTIVLAFERSKVEALAGRDIDVARELWRLTLGKLERSMDHMLMLSRMTAAERVAYFLVDIAERMRLGDGIELPILRDIGDYLGITLETVSRTLSELEVNGSIERSPMRHIKISNLSGLKGLGSGL